MPGRFFQNSSQEILEALEARENLVDIGVLEDLVLEARREAGSSTNEFAERAALAAFCCIAISLRNTSFTQTRSCCSSPFHPAMSFSFTFRPACCD